MLWNGLAVLGAVVYTISPHPPVLGFFPLKTFVVLCAAALAAIAASTSATAQAVPRPSASIPTMMAVRGVAYDSIRRQPLRDAFVSILGSGAGARNTTTDSHGRFQFDSVSPGDYTFAVQHAVLDSLGLSGVSRKATVAREGDEVRLGVPSFGTLWRIECAGLRVPKDSGFVFGTVRDAATMRPLAHARVEVTWVELGLKSGHVTGRSGGGPRGSRTTWATTASATSPPGRSCRSGPPERRIRSPAARSSFRPGAGGSSGAIYSSGRRIPWRPMSGS